MHPITSLFSFVATKNVDAFFSVIQHIPHQIIVSYIVDHSPSEILSVFDEHFPLQLVDDIYKIPTTLYPKIFFADLSEPIDIFTFDAVSINSFKILVNETPEASKFGCEWYGSLYFQGRDQKMYITLLAINDMRKFKMLIVQWNVLRKLIKCESEKLIA
jgi:hypothetical protein